MDVHLVKALRKKALFPSRRVKVRLHYQWFGLQWFEIMLCTAHNTVHTGVMSCKLYNMMVCVCTCVCACECVCLCTCACAYVCVTAWTCR